MDNAGNSALYSQLWLTVLFGWITSSLFSSLWGNNDNYLLLQSLYGLKAVAPTHQSTPAWLLIAMAVWKALNELHLFLMCATGKLHYL